jgi:NADH-quinone oxidoreductase subunit G
MPKIIIDDREIEVPDGTKVIEAAELLGIMIPRFCYHPALGSVGACRVCAVKFLEGPFKGVQMSCMIDAKDGMVISTTDEEAVEFREYVIEWLMLHHPHDCPVCDEGGHCLLQDMTISGGHGIRRYLGLKRTYQDQYLGPLVQHEMNRCIHCYRCSRFYQEFAGYRDLGVMQCANHIFFGRHKEGILESPFTGNLSDICPTGVFTDKPSRYFGRRWDYERTPSVCINCSLGCHTVASARYREVVRQEARYSEALNGHFICDRGRHGFHYARHEKRPRRALIVGEEVTHDLAMRAFREQLAKIRGSAGPEAIACVGSDRSSLEAQAMLKQVSQLQGWRGPSYFMDSRLAQKVKTASSRLEPGLTVSLRELETADFVLVVGADPLNEAPMLALEMRQAQRRNANIVVIDPRPISLPFDFKHLPLPLEQVNLCLGALMKAAANREAAKELGPACLDFYEAIPALDSLDPSLGEEVSKVAQELRASKRPIIVCGTEVVRQATPALAADSALLLQAMNKQAGLLYLMPAANTFGASLLSNAEGSFAEILDDIETGRVRGLILVESNPYWYFQDTKRLDDAIEKLDLLVVLDYVNSTAAQKAHVFLPTSTLYEAGGIFINQEGRVQAAPWAYRGGISLALISSGDHPPRVYGSDIPGAEPRAAWRILAELVNPTSDVDAEATHTKLRTWLAEVNPILKDIPAINEFPADGIRLSLGEAAPRFSLDWLAEAKTTEANGHVLELVLVDWTFGTEELSALSPPLREVERNPCLVMHVDDAAKLGLKDNDEIAIKLDRGVLEVSLCTSQNMAAGVIVLPRHRLLEWQKVRTQPKFVRFEDIEKLNV